LVTFTIVIKSTPKSAAPAYDVLMTDPMPTGLGLDQTSVHVKNSAGLPSAVVTTTDTNLKITWAYFPVGETSTITFDARFIGPPPVTNKVSVQWSSIPIEPLPPFTRRSPYNQHSTERSYDPHGNTLNDYGTTSSITLRVPALPNTGFAPGLQTLLPVQPSDKAYDTMDNMTLEIPALHLRMPIVGVPAGSDGWDLTWLSNQAGYLEGTTYPTQVGTTGLTGHVYLADGTPGPFVHLGDLRWGDQVIIHANGQRYIYEMRTSRVVLPNDLSIFANDGYTWLTLLTCKDYLPALKTYDYRLAVRAVLVKVEADSTPAGQ